jgi:hypothetical protein
MDIESFMPDAAAVEQIRRDLAVYEPEREKAIGQVAWRVPLFLAPVMLVAALLVIAAWNIAPEGKQPIWGFISACAGIALCGMAYGLARKPAADTQQWLRDRILPIAFGFIDDLRYGHEVTPTSYSHLPKEVTGTADRQEFDDVILGRHGDQWFEVFECNLTRGYGKTKETLFKGVVLAFRLDAPFPGKLIATRKPGGVAKWMRGLFGKGDLAEVTSGDGGLDYEYEFRTDQPDAAADLFKGNFRKGLSWVRDTWPGGSARVALSGDDGFLLLPSTTNFFELPDISVTLDYEAHIQPIAAQMASLIATASLLRRACVPSTDDAV